MDGAGGGDVGAVPAHPWCRCGVGSGGWDDDFPAGLDAAEVVGVLDYVDRQGVERRGVPTGGRCIQVALHASRVNPQEGGARGAAGRLADGTRLYFPVSFPGVGATRTGDASEAYLLRWVELPGGGAGAGRWVEQPDPVVVKRVFPASLHDWRQRRHLSGICENPGAPAAWRGSPRLSRA